MEAKLSSTGTHAGSESRMSHTDPAATTPPRRPAVASSQSSLWTDFLRRNLVQASEESAAKLREGKPADAPPVTVAR